MIAYKTNAVKNSNLIPTGPSQSSVIHVKGNKKDDGRLQIPLTISALCVWSPPHPPPIISRKLLRGGQNISLSRCSWFHLFSRLYTFTANTYRAVTVEKGWGRIV